MERIVTKVAAILPAVDWFEIRGTKKQPKLSRVAYWSHVKYVNRDPVTGEPLENEHDIVVGITGTDVPLAGDDYLDMESPAGYIHLNDLDEAGTIPSSQLDEYVWDE